MGMMCASSGWSVEASARIAILAPRRLRCRALARRRKVVVTDDIGWASSITAQAGSQCIAAPAFGRFGGSNGSLYSRVGAWLFSSSFSVLIGALRGLVLLQTMTAKHAET